MLHILGKFWCYQIVVLGIWIFKCFRTSRNCHFRLFWGNFLARISQNVVSFFEILNSDESIKKWSHLVKKIDFFAHFVSFCFIYALFYPMIFAPRFYQMKCVIKIYVYGKFHQHSICGWEVENFQHFSYWLSRHEMAPFGFVWTLTPQNIVQSCWNFDQWYSQIRQTQCLKNPSKFSILAQMECTHDLQFSPIWGSILPPENQKYC